ncbi:MAG: hypothetical protein AABY22_30230 [Nanoarchaeota archaeon]
MVKTRTNFSIDNLVDLHSFFMDDYLSELQILERKCYILNKIRKECLLQHLSFIKGGNIYKYCFKSIGGGVYEASVYKDD